MNDRVKGKAFTLIELLVVVAIIAILVGILLPSLSRARRIAKTTTCSSRLKTHGQGLAIYANEYDDVLVPHRMPRIDNEHWRADVEGGLKYRPTFLAMLGSQLGIPPFDDPMPSRLDTDCQGEPGDRQNYANEVYVCPEVAEWTDERNACYGYNYQFLGNARLREMDDPSSYKNWPVYFSRVKGAAQTVAVGDSLGTAAGFARVRRTDYQGENRRCDKASRGEFGDAGPPINGRSLNARGNEGLVLDPPIIDPNMGEIAGREGDAGGSGGEQVGAASPLGGWPGYISLGGGEEGRSAVDPRHGNKGNILWLDGHVSLESLQALGYWVEDSGAVGLGDIELKQGNNRFWAGGQRNRVWLLD